MDQGERDASLSHVGRHLPLEAGCRFCVCAFQDSSPRFPQLLDGISFPGNPLPLCAFCHMLLLTDWESEVKVKKNFFSYSCLTFWGVVSCSDAFAKLIIHSFICSLFFLRSVSRNSGGAEGLSVLFPSSPSGELKGLSSCFHSKVRDIDCSQCQVQWWRNETVRLVVGQKKRTCSTLTLFFPLFSGSIWII